MEKELAPSDFYTNLYDLYTGEPTSGKRLVYPVDLTEVADALTGITQKLGVSKAEAIRRAVKAYAEELQGLEVITYREVSKEQAKREIREYIKGKERVRADEISDTLRIELGLVNQVLLELWQEGWVEPE